MDPRNLSTTPNDRTTIRTPEGYLRALHPPNARGKVSLLAKTRNETFARCFAPDEIAPVLETWLETTAYVSVNRYAGPRGGHRPISALNCLYADLDVYTRPDLMFLEPGEAEDAIIRRMAALELPEPSMLIDSGRGFYVLWLIDPLPGQAIRRWQAAERCLVELLAPLGADPACCDAARVLRIPGTTNRKADRIVTVVGGDGRRHAFDDLADRIYRAAGRPSRGEITARRRRKAENKPSDTVRGLPPAARFGAVLRDLERLRLAWGGEMPDGFRNTWLHLVVTALGHVLPADEIEAEAWRLAALGTPGLRNAEVKATVKAAVARAEKVAGPFTGLSGDPRLHYSGERMAEILGLDRALAERLGLEQIVPPDLRRDRRNAARRARRRAAGGQSRDEYLDGKTISKEKPWVALGVSRSTYYARRSRRPSAEPVPAGGSSALDAARTGPVPPQGALGAAAGPERSSRNKESPALPPNPPGGQPSPGNEPTCVAAQPSRGRPEFSARQRFPSKGIGTAQATALPPEPTFGAAAPSGGAPKPGLLDAPPGETLTSAAFRERRARVRKEEDERPLARARLLAPRTRRPRKRHRTTSSAVLLARIRLRTRSSLAISFVCVRLNSCVTFLIWTRGATGRE